VNSQQKMNVNCLFLGYLHMKTWWEKTILVISILVIGFSAGCGESAKKGDAGKELAPEIDLGTTVGSLVEVFQLIQYALKASAW